MGFDLFTGIGRACGNALGLTRDLHAHSAVIVRVGSPRCARLQQEIPLGWGARRRGARESVARSRPAEPVASRYPASARFESSFACLESWHRAPLLAEEELGTNEGRGCRRAPLPGTDRNGCGSSLFNHSRPKPRILGGLSRRSSSKAEKSRQVLEIRRGSAFVVVRTPGGSERARRARSSVPPQGACGHHVGLGIRHEGFVRTTAPEVSGHALPVFSCEEQGSRSLARAEAIHAARRTSRRSHPSEERRCLPLCGRANVPRGGRKRRRHVLPSSNPQGHREGGGLARLKDIESRFPDRSSQAATDRKSVV